MTRVLLRASGGVISPFGYPPGDAPVQGRTLAEFQREALAACGLPAPTAEPGPGPTLVINDDLLVGRRLLAEFVREAQRAPSGRVMLELIPSVFTREYAALQDTATGPQGGPLMPLWWLAEGGAAPETLDGQDFETVSLSVKEKVIRIPVPAHWFGKDALELPMTGLPAMRVRHWLHLLFAQRVASAERWLAAPPWRRALRIAQAIVTAILPTPSRVLRRLSDIGRGCSIHPTAVIEASTLGPGVRVGAHAVIKFSRIGAGSVLMDGANVSFSTLGARCHVGTHCAVNFSLLHDEATAAQSLLQMSVLGRRTITTGMGYITDMKMAGGDISVLDGGSVVPSGQRFLGAAIGDEAVLGSGVWVAHGREIPNGYVVTRAPDAILHRVTDDLPRGTPLKVVDGGLKPL